MKESKKSIAGNPVFKEQDLKNILEMADSLKQKSAKDFRKEDLEKLYNHEARTLIGIMVALEKSGNKKCEAYKVVEDIYTRRKWKDTDGQSRIIGEAVYVTKQPCSYQRYEMLAKSEMGAYMNSIEDQQKTN